ncbi:MAG: hypothetical protein AAFY60_01605, partial [Myxococcota bacterium]
TASRDSTWVSLSYYQRPWCRCEGADFESLEAVGPLYQRDKRRVWFMGEEIQEANPETASGLARQTLVDGGRVWHGTTPLDVSANTIAPVNFGRYHGDLIHYGNALRVHGFDGRVEHLIDAPSSAPFDLVTTLRPVFESMWLILNHALPIQHRAGEMGPLFERREELLAAEALPEFSASLDTAGSVTVKMSGQKTTEPLSAWYTLGCRLCAVAKKQEASVIYYPSVGTMLPDGRSLHTFLMRQHPEAFGTLINECHRLDLEEARSALAHMLLACTYYHYSTGHRPEEDKSHLRALARIPASLMHYSFYRPRRHQFESTTNLSVSRYIIRERILEAPDFRDRIDACGVLHGAILSTNKVKHVFKDVVPSLLNRYDSESRGDVREMLGAVLEAVLIRGQVDAEVSQRFHSDALLPVIDFCIERSINPRFNRARRVDTLWALGRDEEASIEQKSWIEQYGSDSTLQGVYAHRHVFRRAELWFLRGRIDSAYRTSAPQEHRERAKQLRTLFKELLDELGPEAKQWDETKSVRADLNRYVASVKEL